MKTRLALIGGLVLLVILTTVIAANKSKEITSKEETLLRSVLTEDQYSDLKEQYQEMDNEAVVNLMVQKAREYEQKNEPTESDATASDSA